MVCLVGVAQGFFVEPTIAELPSSSSSLLQEEVFAPIMYVVKVSSLDHAIAINNDVPQVGDEDPPHPHLQPSPAGLPCTTALASGTDRPC